MMRASRHSCEEPKNITFLFVRPDICRQLPSDSTSQCPHLALGNVIPAIRVHSGHPPVRQCSCRAYKPKSNSRKKAFALSERQLCYPITTGRCPVLSADLAPSGRKLSFRSFRIPCSHKDPCRQALKSVASHSYGWNRRQDYNQHQSAIIQKMMILQWNCGERWDIFDFRACKSIGLNVFAP